MNYEKKIIFEKKRIYAPVNVSVFSTERAKLTEYDEIVIRKNSPIRSRTILSCDVTPGDGFSAIHNVLIREHAMVSTQEGFRVISPMMVRS